ncbi:MAG: transposase [Planctomycetota bacterium]
MNKLFYIGSTPRTLRKCSAGTIFHILNRAVARLQIFVKREDYAAFFKALDETFKLVRLPIYGICIIPNHWHFIVDPSDDKQVSEFFRRLTVTHTMRWHAHYKTSGTGHLYQGRLKSFPVQDDEHLLWVMRYVERNALRANLVEKAEDWEWSSAYLRRLRQSERPIWLKLPKSLSLPRNWRSLVNKPLNERESEAIQIAFAADRRTEIRNGQLKSAARLGMQSTLRALGRPRFKKHE